MFLVGTFYVNLNNFVVANKFCFLFSLLVTGSADSTIFTFSVHSTDTYPTIVPIGYVKVPSAVTCMTWNPQEVNATIIMIT